MLAVNAHLMLAVIPIYIGSAKVQQNSNFTKRKSDFFSSPSYFIPSLFLLYCHLIPDSRAPVYFFGTKVSQV